ncbi:MAG: hypothetical protein REI64_11890 [Pedobacter sp.]|uniref:hypothetical protein n=1 Tax=Bacteroidota TaxID=976 RepID=UPI002807CB89|nr:hypothetical protein [Pedobacter sp.]MDQ8005493.1 hypothetical protein [Pedobacter sp.]
MTDYNVVYTSEEEKNRWRNERWERDGVSNLLSKDGFTFKSHGRSGYIYYTEQGTLIEIYVEMSGVKEYDMSVYFDENLERFPNRTILNEDEKEIMRGKLLAWLDHKGIRNDL